jgi:ABC-type phosphate transport system permease subunit
MDKHEYLKFSIERFDHYFESVNNKGALFLAVNTFIVGGLIALYLSIRSAVDCGVWINTIYALIVLFGIVSILLTLLAGIPFLSNPNNSVLYFGSIASKSVAEFKAQVHAQTLQTLEDDYIEQVHILAFGLRRKFRKLRYASHLIFLEFILAIPLIILLMNNVKNAVANENI